MTDAVLPLVVEFDVETTLDHAFSVWTERPTLWWPAGHTTSGAPEVVVIEPGPGGRIYERTSSGEQVPWGEVLTWEPPTRLRFLWHLFVARDEATEVEITFTRIGSATRVRLVQTGWDALGEAGIVRRERTVVGWAAVTEPYRRAVEADARRVPSIPTPEAT
jgi:uncharacterized protein YndB with AHSA1/START domain